MLYNYRKIRGVRNICHLPSRTESHWNLVDHDFHRSREGIHKDRQCLVCEDRPVIPGASWNYHAKTKHLLKQSETIEGEHWRYPDEGDDQALSRFLG